MVRLIVLGASNLLATETRRPTHLACLGEEHGLLIDCGVSPRGRLEALGADPNRIGDVFITHFHPDHAAGLTLFLMELCLRGRSAPVRVHSGAESIRRIRKVMQMYGWKKMPGQFPVGYRTVKRGKRTPVLANAEFRAFSTPVRHVVPALGLRVDILTVGKSFVYSSDTEPSANLVALARDADLLIHEATGEGPGHSSAAQAAAAARDAGVRRLLLIHTNPYADGDALLAEARAVFHGEVSLAADKMEIDW
ncbi:MAG: MBL fold metallo-hydrolase [Anaerolineales bacterium]|nr:MBL fold metallo-hydrolase [Anaerolineales bacterium]